MSAIATFYLLDLSKLDELKQNAEVIITKKFFSKKVTDNYWHYLENNATKLKDFDGSEYLYANLVVFLEEEKNISLTHNEYDGLVDELNKLRRTSHFIFPFKQKMELLQQLAPARYSLDELQQFNKDFSGDADIDTATLTLKALQALYDNLNQLQKENQLLLLIIA